MLRFALVISQSPGPGLVLSICDLEYRHTRTQIRSADGLNLLEGGIAGDAEWTSLCFGSSHHPEEQAARLDPPTWRRALAQHHSEMEGSGKAAWRRQRMSLVVRSIDLI